MKAAELDQNNPKIVANVVLYLLANGDQTQALVVMNQQKLAPDVRAAIRNDAAKVAAAGRAQGQGQGQVQGHLQGQGPGQGQGQGQTQQQAGATADARTVASVGIEPAPRLLQRFAQ
jgi:hypothetical protein